MSSSNLGPEDFSIAIICALHEELTACLLILDHEIRSERLLESYLYGRIGKHNVVLVGPAIGFHGTSSASEAVSDFRKDFPHINLGINVGIAGATPSKEHDIRLGDVVISEPGQTYGGVVQHDFGKITSDGFKRTGALNMPPKEFRRAAGLLRAQDLVLEAVNQTVLEGGKKNPKYRRPRAEDILFRPGNIHPHGYRNCSACRRKAKERRPKRKATGSVAHYGIIVSGNKLIQDAKTRDELRDEYHCLCAEMELAGIMNILPCIGIRGISDYCDSHKNDTWRYYASLTAAAWAKELLNYVPKTISMAQRASDLMQESKEARKKTLQSLCFKEYNVRENTLTEAIPKTFEWIFESELSSNVSPPSFSSPNEAEESLSSTGPDDTYMSGMDDETSNLSVSENQDDDTDRDTESDQDEARSVDSVLESEEGPESNISDPDSDTSSSSASTNASEDIDERFAACASEYAQKLTGFPEFLQGVEAVFWITGKPGTGKSTLMLFIRSHSNTETLLQAWAGGRALIICSYFCYLPGPPIMSTCVGLLRSIAYQLASQDETICAQFTSFQDPLTADWTVRTLQECLSAAVAKVHDKAFFIILDGLDEITDDEDAKENLLEFLIGMTKNGHVKLLLASREESIFERNLSDKPHLRMQEFCFRDIVTYIKKQLEKFPDEDRLKKKITLASDGIFLWVSIVTSTVRRCLRNGDKRAIIRKVLRNHPKELKDLYAHLFSNIPNHILEEAKKYFRAMEQIRLLDQSTVLQSLVIFFLAVEDDRSMYTKTYTPKSTKNRSKRLLKFINECSAFKKHVEERTRNLLIVKPIAEAKAEHDFEYNHCRFKQFTFSQSPSNRVTYSHDDCVSLPTKKMDELVRLHSLKVDYLHRSVYEFLSSHMPRDEPHEEESDRLRSVLQRWCSACLKFSLKHAHISYRDLMDRVHCLRLSEAIYFLLTNACNHGDTMLHDYNTNLEEWITECLYAPMSALSRCDQSEFSFIIGSISHSDDGREDRSTALPFLLLCTASCLTECVMRHLQDRQLQDNVTDLIYLHGKAASFLEYLKEEQFEKHKLLLNFIRKKIWSRVPAIAWQPGADNVAREGFPARVDSCLEFISFHVFSEHPQFGKSMSALLYTLETQLKKCLLHLPHHGRHCNLEYFNHPCSQVLRLIKLIRPYIDRLNCFCRLACTFPTGHSEKSHWTIGIDLAYVLDHVLQKLSQEHSHANIQTSEPSTPTIIFTTSLEDGFGPKVTFQRIFTDHQNEKRLLEAVFSACAVNCNQYCNHIDETSCMVIPGVDPRDYCWSDLLHQFRGVKGDLGIPPVSGWRLPPGTLPTSTSLLWLRLLREVVPQFKDAYSIQQGPNKYPSCCDGKESQHYHRDILENLSEDLAERFHQVGTDEHGWSDWTEDPLDDE